MQAICEKVTLGRSRLRSDNSALRASSKKLAAKRSSNRRLAIPQASTTWLLDGVGCAGSRSGDDHLVGLTQRASNSSRRECELDPSKCGPVPDCPLRPINVSNLCDSHEGKFEMLDVVFEKKDDHLFVYSADYVQPVSEE